MNYKIEMIFILIGSQYCPNKKMTNGMKIVSLELLKDLNDNLLTMSPTKIAILSDKPLLDQILDLITSSFLQTTIANYKSDKHCTRVESKSDEDK